MRLSKVFIKVRYLNSLSISIDVIVIEICNKKIILTAKEYNRKLTANKNNATWRLSYSFTEINTLPLLGSD
jgi:hypothetical protein